MNGQKDGGRNGRGNCQRHRRNQLTGNALAGARPTPRRGLPAQERDACIDLFVGAPQRPDEPALVDGHCHECDDLSMLNRRHPRRVIVVQHQHGKTGGMSLDPRQIGALIGATARVPDDHGRRVRRHCVHQFADGIYLSEAELGRKVGADLGPELHIAGDQECCELRLFGRAGPRRSCLAGFRILPGGRVAHSAHSYANLAGAIVSSASRKPCAVANRSCGLLASKRRISGSKRARVAGSGGTTPSR